jgi:multidrug efflux pump subunit AcrA (membrane-fusion protein)
MRAHHPALLSATALAALLGLSGCKPKLVAVARVVQADAGSHQYTGVVGARVESNLGFRVAGKVVERLVDTGQAVRKG